MAKTIRYVVLSIFLLVIIFSWIAEILPMSLRYIVLSAFILLGILGMVSAVFQSRFQRKWQPGIGLWGSGSKGKKLCEYLQTIGINASVLEKGGLTKEIKGQPREGVLDSVIGRIKLQGRNIESINVVFNGSLQLLDYIVTSLNYDDGRRRSAYLEIKRNLKDELLTYIHIYSRSIADLEWKGDPGVARELNYDSQLMNKLRNTDLSPLRGYLKIVPEPKYGCVRIRTSYFLPTSELFDVLESIAKHIKST